MIYQLPFPCMHWKDKSIGMGMRMPGFCRSSDVTNPFSSLALCSYVPPSYPEQSTSLTPAGREHQTETPKVLFLYDALLGGM